MDPEENHGATVYVDGQNVTDKFITINIFSQQGRYLNHWVVIFEQERNVSEIAFCNDQPTCGTEMRQRH